MKLGSLMKQVKKMIKKSNKKYESSCSFWRHNADKYGYMGPFDKNQAQPKSRLKGEIFSMNLTLMYCSSPYVPEKCFLMPLLLLYDAK